VSQWLTQTAWGLWKDILLTFGGLAIILAEVFVAATPDTAVIAAGLAMTGIGAGFHAGRIIGGFGGKPSSSPPTPPHGLPRSPTSQEPSGNGH
jgi:hypothetical protein